MNHICLIVTLGYNSNGYNGITYPFHLVKNTQEVAGVLRQNFLFGPLPVQQFLDEDRILGDIF